MQIYIASGNQGGSEVGTWECELLCSLAGARHGQFSLAHSPDDADIILVADIFFDHHFWRVLCNPLIYRNLNRVYLYCEKGIVSRILPGLFTSMPKRPWDLGRYRTAMYSSHNRSMQNPYLEQERSDPIPKWLFSYMGRNSHPVRPRLLQRLQGAENAWIENTDSYEHWNPTAPDREEQQRRYARTIAQSKFVLCPRGWSPSTIRVYEVMQMGRVPVIISDAWRPPIGPDWTSFALFVAEKDIDQIPKILHTRQLDAAAMGHRARAAWETHFAPDAEWNTLASSLADLHAKRQFDERWLVPLWPLFCAAIALHYAGYRLGNNLRNLKCQGRPRA